MKQVERGGQIFVQFKSQRKFEGVDHFIEKKKRENASLFF